MTPGMRIMETPSLGDRSHVVGWGQPAVVVEAQRDTARISAARTGTPAGVGVA